MLSLSYSLYLFIQVIFCIYVNVSEVNKLVLICFNYKLLENLNK